MNIPPNILLGGILCVLCVGWVSGVFRKSKLITQAVDQALIDEIEIKSNDRAFDVLRSLEREKNVTIKALPALAYFRYFGEKLGSPKILNRFIGICWGVFEIAKIFINFILIPISLFFMYTHWFLVVPLILFYYCFFQGISRFAASRLEKTILDDRDRFDQMYRECAFRICRNDGGNAVAFPLQWVDAVELWDSWRQKLRTTMSEIEAGNDA